MHLVKLLPSNSNLAFLKARSLPGLVVILLIFSQLSVSAVPFSGSGTVADPYLITTPAQMDSVRNYAKAGKKFRLMNDLDLTAVNWNPIVLMQATFDGNGHKIKYSLTATDQNNLGLFGMTTDTIKNLTVEATISASGTDTNHNIGGLAGTVADGKVLNCHVTGTILVSGCYNIGGLAGSYYTNSTVINCSFTGKVTGGYDIGGLIGSGTGTVSGCSAKGTVSGNSSVGGFIGETLYNHVSYCNANCDVYGNVNSIGGFAGGCFGTIDHCYSTGNVTASNAYSTGGFVGRLFSGGVWSISSCYSTGTVKSPQEAIGGFAGSAENNINNCYSSGEVNGNNYVGGFAGDVYHSSVSTCYSVGAVYGNSYFAGLVGVNNGTTTSGYFDKITSWQSSGTAYNGSGYTAIITGATTAEMKTQSTFQPTSDWNFTTTWQINEGYTYPVLRGINNAPFAFRDTLLTQGSFNLATVTSNDYDFETGQTILVYKILQVYGTGTVNNGTYSFPGGSTLGFTDSVLYRIGELLAPGDTLWGNTTRAIIKKGTAGNGTAGNPYLIYSPQDMNAVRDHLGSTFKLMADLDLTADYPNWVPIGVGGASFTGTFNGNGHAIKYQISNASSYAGLFGVIIGNISNLSVDANISSINDYIGGLVGANNSGTISNCTVTGSISGGSYIGGLLGNNGVGSITSCSSSATVSGTGERIGGLIGQVQSGDINDCSAAGNVTGPYMVGGLIGLINGNVTNCHSASSVAGGDVTGGLIGSFISGNIANCYSRGSVSCTSYGGGLIGFCNGGTITSCNSAANVVVNGDYAGGLISYSAGMLTLCFSTGSVTGVNNVGGLIGLIDGNLSKSYSTSTVSGYTVVGGLLGGNNSGVSNCYSTGRVTGTSTVGGIVGNNYGGSTIDSVYSAGKVTGTGFTGALVGANFGTITSGYYDTNTSGKSLAMGYGTGSVTGLNTTDMKKVANFTGLNFTTTWQINENHTYPALKDINNAPIAFRDSVSSADTINLTAFNTNDYDIETVQAKLVAKVWPGYSSNRVSNGKYAFPAGSVPGFTDSLLYRVGEVISAGDTLWGNIAIAILNEIPGLSASPATVQLRAANGSSAAITVHSNVDWNAVSSETWLTLGAPSGSGQASLSLTASENTGADRNATVTLSATALPNVVITVKQVAKLPLTISIAAQNKTYDGTDNASVTVSNVSGKLPTDVITINATGHFANKYAGTGKTVTADISLSGADAANYTYNATATNTANISKASLVAGISAQNKVYDGTTGAVVTPSIVSGYVTGDDVTIHTSGSVFDNKNAGSGKTVTANISLSGADIANYTVNSTANTTADVTKAVLNVNLSAQNKVYNGNTDASVTATIASGLITGDNVTVNAANGKFGNKNAGSDKTVTADITLGGTDAGNYSANVSGATASINKALLIIDLTAQNKVYDGTANAVASASIINGLISGDDVTAGASYQMFDNKNTGTGKMVTAYITLSGTDAGNYTCNAQVASAADITKKPLTIDVSAKNKAYDGTTTAQANTSITGGLVNGDSVSIVASGDFTSKDLGYKNASFNISLAGPDAGNYTAATPVASIAMITPAKLGIKLNVQDKAYDGTTNATATASIISGLVAGEAVTVTVNSCSFIYKNVGDSAQAYGTVSISGADVSNYYIENNYMTSYAKISPLSLVIALKAENKTYNGNTNVNLTASINGGLLAGDTVTAYAYGAFADKNAGTGKIVNANIYIGAKDMSNYTFTSTGTTTANIEPMELLITTEGIDKEYDGNTNAYIRTRVTNGPLPNDVVTVNATGQYENKNTGTDKPVHIDLSLSGADAGNYTCNSTATATASIIKANLAASLSVSPNTSVCTGGVPVIITAEYAKVIDESEGAPSISLKGDGVNLVAAMTSTDRKTWTYQWTPPVEGNGTVEITTKVEDIAGNFDQITGGLSSLMYANAPTQVSDIVAYKAVKVYPTISNGLFYIAIDNPDKGRVQVRIVNMSGLVIKECQYTKASSSQVLEVSVDHAIPGEYIVEISINDTREVYRIIKK